MAVAITVRDMFGKEYRMLRGLDSVYYFIRNIKLSKDSEQVRDFIEFWDEISPKLRDEFGLYPSQYGLVVVDLKKKIILINISPDFLGVSSIIKNVLEEVNGKLYGYTVMDFLRMKADILKLGFKLSKDEEESWDDYLMNFRGGYHLEVGNVK